MSMSNEHDAWRSWLNHEPIEVYKDDGRSRVWRVQTDDVGDVVIKRFDHAGLRQVLSWPMHLHPAQLEMRGTARLRDAQIPVVEPIAQGWVGQGLHAKRSFVYPYAGPTLQQLMGESRWQANHSFRHCVLDGLQTLTSKLLQANLVHRDLKVSNLVLPEITSEQTGRDQVNIQCIDAGAVRRSRSPRRRAHTVGMLLHTLRKAGLDEANCTALSEAFVEQGWPEPTRF